MTPGGKGPRLDWTVGNNVMSDTAFPKAYGRGDLRQIFEFNFQLEGSAGTSIIRAILRRCGARA